MTTEDLARIPDRLKVCPQWVTWRQEIRHGKPQKINYDPRTGTLAKVNDPTTWTSYADAVARLDQFDGLGFALTTEDSFTGVDLDRCVDPSTGRIDPWALAIVDNLHTYTELSPSSEGIRAFCQGDLPTGWRKQGVQMPERLRDNPGKQPALELYDRNHFLSVTGRHLPDTPLDILDRHTTLQLVHAAYAKKNGHPQLEPQAPVRSVRATDETDSQLLEKMFNSKSGAKIRALHAGDWSGYPSQSEADMAYALYLAFWCGCDQAKMDRLFRQSGLMRNKWEEIHSSDGHSYGTGTIAAACARCTNTYDPPRTHARQGVSMPETNHQADEACESAPDVTGLNGMAYEMGSGPAPTTLAPETDARPRCTDVGNGALFARQHRASIRYCYPMKQWFVWDGQRWKPDNGGRITMLAKQTARSLYALAADEPDEICRKALAKWASESETERRLKSMVSLAQSEPGIAVDAETLDADPLLLTVLNGTLDLRTGTLHPARPEDFITKMTPVVYRSGAACPEFERLITRLFEHVPAVQQYLQRIFGYSLTGATSEQCFFIFHGVGANGKSTILRTVLDLLGDYAATTRPETFLVKHGEGIPNDVAALAGARFVVALESEQGKRLAEGLIKGVTGDDKLSARFLHREFFTFAPQFKFFIGTNHKPKIRGTDKGMWRRIRCIPFEVVIPDHEQDKHLLAKLRAEFSGILNWLVQGCLAWQRDGLGPPLEVLAATAAYQAEQDTLGAFLKDRCVLEPTAKSTKKELFESYVVWCEESGERHRLTLREFGKALRERGISDAKVGNAKGCIGLRPRTSFDVEPDDDAPVAAQREVFADES